MEESGNIYVHSKPMDFIDWCDNTCEIFQWLNVQYLNGAVSISTKNIHIPMIKFTHKVHPQTYHHSIKLS